MNCCILNPTASLLPKSSSKKHTLLTPQSAQNPRNLSLLDTNKHHPPPPAIDETLLTLLKLRKTEEAWTAYSLSAHLPNPTCLSRLVAQLSYLNTSKAFSRAQAVVRRLRDDSQLQRLDANALGLLAACAAKRGSTLYATSIIKAMLKSNYLPHVKAWSAVVSRLASSPDDGPVEALRLFKAVTRRVRSVKAADMAVTADSRPDTAAFNAAFNACANVGDAQRFVELFDEMKEFGAEPDVLTYNVVIKLCARVGRKDLIVFVLERIIREGIVPCATTFHSMVAAYVGFGDLKMAEKMVQAMREGRRDLCQILRSNRSKSSVLDEGIHDKFVKNSDDLGSNEGNLDKLMRNSDGLSSNDGNLDKLVKGTDGLGSNVGVLDKLVKNSACQPPLLPKTYAPDARIYTTLMKGYMKEERVGDVVQTLEAMRRESDSASHPDNVTYTTVVTALVKSGSMDRARYVLADMARAGVPINRVTYNVLLKGYCQQLQIDKAKEMAQEMVEDAGIKLDVVSYNILIDGCILVDDSAGALAYFNEMRERGIAPSKISYTTLMKAFALSGQPKLAHKVFDEMLKDPRVKADLVAWNMLVEGYCRVGLVEEAKKIIERMKENGFYPDIATYGSLANGIAMARKPGEALLLWNEIKERSKGNMEDGPSPSTLPPIKPDEGLLDSLADVCVRAAFFQKALEIVACMEENGISPNKTKYKRIYVEMHSRMFTSRHASQARQDRRSERKRAAEAFKFWLGLPNSYYGSEWRLEPAADDYSAGSM